MPFPRPVRAVVFDMDGLLIDSEAIVREGMIRAAANLGHEMPVTLCAGMIGLPWAACEALIAAHFGPAFSMEAYRAEERVQMEALFAAGVSLKAGVVELLDHLDALGLPAAVATSSTRRSARTHLGENGVLERFKAIVAREDVERHKPHPDPFLKAAERLAVAPEACLALEDSHNGVRAAHAAGMMTVMVPDLLEPTEEMHGLCVAIAESLHWVVGRLDGD